MSAAVTSLFLVDVVQRKMQIPYTERVKSNANTSAWRHTICVHVINSTITLNPSSTKKRVSEFRVDSRNLN